VTDQELDQLCINTIRTLSMDAVQAANSGHPGTPMALAPLAYTIWQHWLRYDPTDPIWPGRDRFVLSNGHASMLLYSMLHLAGVQEFDDKYKSTGKLAVTLDEIRRFRQLDSKTPGHPEYHWTTGVETTTGPLGQGCGNSVGMAIAGRWLAARYNRPGYELFNYRIYTVCGDGDLMEGISNEAASIAGHQKLANLTWFYDNNRITIEGHTDLAFSEDVATRFVGLGWNVTRVADVNDLVMLDRAIEFSHQCTDRPTMIIVDSHIGYGAPHKQDTASAHGEALGEDEIKLAKKFYGWPVDAKFLVPDGVRERFQALVGKRGKQLRDDWMTLFEKYKKEHANLARELEMMQHRQLPEGWDKDIPTFPADPKGLATRDSSGKVENAVAKNVPWLVGGSADLAPSTKTLMTFEGAGHLQAATPGGRNMHFGIREHGMGAILNGMALSKIRPFGASFLIFSDYCRPSMRLSAIMEVPVIWIFTHDSIGVGEDGPTHQPIEQLAAIRGIPQMTLIRPGDANEVAEAWRLIMQWHHEPVTLVLTRQALPTLDRTRYAPASGVAKGGYILADAPGGKPDVILIATGSELSLCVAAHEMLVKDGVKSRVVSLPSWEIFDKQSQAYRNEVLPPAVKARVAVEQAATMGWERYVGQTGGMVAMRSFGGSAPLKDLQKKFGFTPERVVAAAKEQLKQ
jgi:transketolase